MPPRRSSGQRHRRKRTRVKVVPYVVPTTRRAPGRPMPLTVPTRWVKNIIAIFLLPWCAILTQTFFTAFTRATIHQQLWAGAEFWFFTLGAVLWLIAFFGLPRPVIIYVFGHELTHVLWVWLMGGRVSKFRVSGERRPYRDQSDKFLDRARPLFFPLYSVLAIAVYGIASLFFNVAPYGQLLYADSRRYLGLSSYLHLLDDSKEPDRSERSRNIFSLVFIYVMNLLLLSALLVIASPQITFAGMCRPVNLPKSMGLLFGGHGPPHSFPQ